MSNSIKPNFPLISELFFLSFEIPIGWENEHYPSASDPSNFFLSRIKKFRANPFSVKKSENYRWDSGFAGSFDRREDGFFPIIRPSAPGIST